jgi:peptidoglycan/xylan/chitin deacetylase (PgdA/CDA1 family)
LTQTDRLDRPDDVLVLCYHGVGHRIEQRWTVLAGSFERQIAALRRRGYVGATFSAALTNPPGRRVVAITFDDAYRCVLDVAFPMLSAAGLPATVFVPTAYAAGRRPPAWDGAHSNGAASPDAALACMGWDQLRTLADAGWEIGSHTRTHPRLTLLDGAALTEELAGSRADCEEAMQRPCRALAYPYGDVDQRVVAAAGAAGYAFAATVPHRPEWPLPLRWPRIVVSSSDSDRRFALRTSAAGRRAQAAAFGGAAAVAARRVKRVLAGTTAPARPCP